jgi:hypothetical protein
MLIYYIVLLILKSLKNKLGSGLNLQIKTGFKSGKIMEKKYYYKSFIRMVYGLFGVFISINGYFRFKAGDMPVGAVMFGLGVFALVLFYFYSKFPYIKLGQDGVLRVKAHPLYPTKVIKKENVSAVDKINDFIFLISFADELGKKTSVKINLNLIDKNDFLAAEAIIKSFSPNLSADVNEETL